MITTSNGCQTYTDHCIIVGTTLFFSYWGFLNHGFRLGLVGRYIPKFDMITPVILPTNPMRRFSFERSYLRLCPGNPSKDFWFGAYTFAARQLIC